MSALEHLAAQHGDLADLVEQLGGSELADHASLRLLTAALEQRLQKLEDKLDEAHRHELRVRLAGDADSVGVQITAGVLGTLADAIVDDIRVLLPDRSDAAVADAARLVVTAVDDGDGDEDGGPELVLMSPPRTSDQLLVDPTDGRPVLTAALDRLCVALEDDGSALVAALAGVLVDHPVRLVVTIRTPEGRRDIEVDRARLQTATD